MDSRPARLDAAFAALAHPTRRAIVERLAVGPATVGELATPFDVSLPAVSKHVSVLVDAGLVARERHGRHQTCRLQVDPMTNAAAWFDRHTRFWQDRLDALDNMLEPATREDDQR